MIIKRFGTDIIINDVLDRKKIREIVFNDKKQLIWLQKLLDPVIKKLVIAEIEYLMSNAFPDYLILEIPRTCDFNIFGVNRILFVDSANEDRIKRVMARDNISEEMVKKIIKIQEKNDMVVNDYIYNDKSIADLKNEVLKLHKKYSIIGKGI
jgi:dephospho-CoA kinase